MKGSDELHVLPQYLCPYWMSEQGLALEEKFDFFSGGLIRLKRICGKERFWVTCLMDMELLLQLY